MLMQPEGIPVVSLCGVRILAVTEAQCVELILDALDEGRGGWVVTPNLDIIRQSVQQPQLAAMLARAEILVADGMPLIWASQVQNTPLPERVAGSNLISSLSAGAARRKRSLFLLGGDPGVDGAPSVAEQASDILRSNNPELDIRGTYCPEFGFENDPAQMDAIVEAVKASGADIVFVALGFPKSERLTEKIRGALPNAWWIGVGISFSFLSGNVKRAPLWMQRAGLEWVHRLQQEPGRLAKRYLVHDIPFAVRLFASATRGRFNGE